MRDAVGCYERGCLQPPTGETNKTKGDRGGKKKTLLAIIYHVTQMFGKPRHVHFSATPPVNEFSERPQNRLLGTQNSVYSDILKGEMGFFGSLFYYYFFALFPILCSHFFMDNHS